MIGGVFAEALIAEVTGASFPRFGISSGDRRLDEITIQVRASSRGVFNLRGDEDVFVFTDQSTDDWTFYVVSQAEVPTLRVGGPRGQRRTIGRRRLAENVAPTALHELADAIRAAADQSGRRQAADELTAEAQRLGLEY